MELYLDSAATTSIHPVVLKEYCELINKYFASTGSLHRLGQETLALENEAKNKIATLLKVKPSEILFNSGSTEGNNFAIKGVAFQYKNRGKTIITSKVEHPSVLECFHQLEKDYGFNCIYLDVDSNGVINLNQLKEALNNDVILVSVMYVNHEVGAIQPIKQISSLVRKFPKIIFHTDMTQAIGKTMIDLSLVDIATMSAHKIHGLKGSGFMFKREKVSLYPLISGHPANNVMRAGTSNWPSNVALARALELSMNYLKENNAKLRECQRKIIEGLESIEGIEINTNPEVTISGVVNFSLLGYNPEVIIRALSLKGIYVSSRSVCSTGIADHVSATLDAMNKSASNVVSSIRMSFDHVLEDEEINYLIQSIKECKESIRK